MTKAMPWLNKLVFLTLFIFVGITYVGIGKNYLFDWDEGIYATLGREMRASKDLLTPTWNSELWLEKPPMIAWVTSLGMSLAGENELGSRLFMPIFAGITLYAIFRIGEKLAGPLSGAISLGILGYFNLFLARTRTLNTDGMLLACISLTTWFIMSNAPPIWVGLAIGLSIMVKGPAGLLAIFIALPLLTKKSRSYLLHTLFYILIVTVPWHLYAYLIHGQSFITPYLLEQVLRRATVPIEFHTESRYFYFNFLYQDLGLGIILISLLGTYFICRDWLAKKNTYLFQIIWWLVMPLVLFTLAKTRLSWYILPIYPALALTIGYLFAVLAKQKNSLKVVTILTIGVLLQMLYHAYTYVAPFSKPRELPDLLQIAVKLSTQDGSELAMLVSPSERVAEAILPKDQTISSSFRYGGAPSVVWYSRKHLLYYYNYDHFTNDLALNKNITLVIVSVLDQDKVPSGFTKVIEQAGYIGYVRGANYALR